MNSEGRVPKLPRSNRCTLAVVVGLLFQVLTTSGWAQVNDFPNVSVRLSGGEVLGGTPVAFGLDEVEFLIGGETRRLAFDQIAQIRFSASPARDSTASKQVSLVDGSTLRLRSLRLTDRAAQLELAAGLSLNVGLRNLSQIRLVDFAGQPEFETQFRELIAAQTLNSDAIVIERRGELTTVEGVVGELNNGKLTFSIEDRTAQVDLDKIKAILFYRATGRELASAIGELKLRDGSIIRVRSLAIEAEELVATAVCGEELRLAKAVVSEIDFAAERSVFLSDLDPSTNDWEPLVASSAITAMLRKLKLARFDQAIRGEPLTLQVTPDSAIPTATRLQVFDRGIAINAGGKVAYRLNGQYQTLEGLIGFAPAANDNGNLTLRISVDDQVVWEQHLIKRELSNPVALNLSLNNADRLVITADYRDGRSVGDELHLVDLKVKK